MQHVKKIVTEVTPRSTFVKTESDQLLVRRSKWSVFSWERGDGPRGWRGFGRQRLETAKSNGAFLPVFPRQSHCNSPVWLQELNVSWLSKLKYVFVFT